MGSDEDARAFLGTGAWVPVDVAAQLILHLQMLRLWVRAHEPLDSSLERVIRIELAEVGHLLTLGENGNQLVSADRWKAAVCRLRHLRKWLTRVR
jgi:hypothetical protein